MRLTSKQKAKLATITNPQQREMLLDAIRQGMEIPEYAWQPLPADLDLDDVFRQMRQILEDLVDEIGVNSAAEDQPDPWVCPICRASCYEQDACEHFALTRYDLDGLGLVAADL